MMQMRIRLPFYQSARRTLLAFCDSLLINTLWSVFTAGSSKTVVELLTIKCLSLTKHNITYMHTRMTNFSVRISHFVTT